MNQVTLPLPSLGPAGAPAAVDVVWLALAYLNGSPPQGNAKPAPSGSALLPAQVVPSVPGTAGQTPLPQGPQGQQGQQGALMAKGGTDLPPQNSAMPSATVRAPEGAAPPDGRSAARDVFVAEQPRHAALVMRSHGAIAGLLRADAVLQIADSVLQKIDERLGRMQDIARRAAAGPPTAQALVALDLPFQKLKQEVLALVPPVAFGGGAGGETATQPTEPAGTAAVQAMPVGDSAQPAQAVNSPTATLQQRIPVIVEALTQTGLSNPSQIIESDAVLAVVRSNGSAVQNLVASQREVLGSLLSQELSRRIGLSDSTVDRPASAVLPNARLSSTVAAALLVQPLPGPVGASAAMGTTDGEVPFVGGDGKSARQVSAESLALLIAQPNRAGIVSLLLPAAGALDEPTATGPQNLMPMGDRPLPLPPPVSGMAAEVLFGLVPGWRARSRDGLARPKRPSGPRKKGRPRRRRDDPYV